MNKRKKFRKNVKVRQYYRRDGTKVRSHNRKITLHHKTRHIFDPSLHTIIRSYKETRNPNAIKGKKYAMRGSYQHRAKDPYSDSEDEVGLISIDPSVYFNENGDFKSSAAEKKFYNTMLHEELHHFDMHYQNKQPDGINMNDEKGIYFAAEHASGVKPWAPNPEKKREIFNKKLQLQIIAERQKNAMKKRNDLINEFEDQLYTGKAKKIKGYKYWR